jgi:hypothetical protein
MRAVPEDFDSLSALHSPYGAVHGLGTPLTSPVDLGASPYADHMIRPLMVDVRRHDSDDHLSPTGLSPAFGSIGFGPSAGLGTPDMLSPISPTSTDHRYGYSSYPSAASLGAGPRTSNPFARQASFDSGMQSYAQHARRQIRPLQPLQLRDTLTRPRSDTLQSPLRSSMSWKGDALDYTTYHGGNPSPQIGARHHSLYQQDSVVGASSASGLGPYDSSNYSASTVHSPTHYSGFQSSSLQAAAAASQQRGSRLRAASASLPLGLDPRTQFRSPFGSGGLQNTTNSHHSPSGPGPRTTASSAAASHLGALSVSSSYTGSFPSAPLTAPVDFSLPRTSAAGGYRTSSAATADHYSMPQLSAPITQPTDFFQASATATRTPLRDTFGGPGGGGPLGLGGGAGGQSRVSSGGGGGGGAGGGDDYAHDPLGLRRKRSFTGPSSSSSAGVTAAGTGGYGSAA